MSDLFQWIQILGTKMTKGANVVQSTNTGEKKHWRKRMNKYKLVLVSRKEDVEENKTSGIDQPNKEEEESSNSLWKAAWFCKGINDWKQNQTGINFEGQLGHGKNHWTFYNRTEVEWWSTDVPLRVSKECFLDTLELCTGYLRHVSEMATNTNWLVVLDRWNLLAQRNFVRWSLSFASSY